MNPRNFRINLVEGKLSLRWTQRVTRRDVVTSAVVTGDEEQSVILPPDVTAVVAGLLHPALGHAELDVSAPPQPVRQPAAAVKEPARIEESRRPQRGDFREKKA